jgi:hypothetical protein
LLNIDSQILYKGTSNLISLHLIEMLIDDVNSNRFIISLKEIYLFVMKVVVVALVMILTANSLDNGLGRTPPLGWNSWNHFGCQINETIVKQTADLLISTGLAAKGYKYLNIDDCWQISRNETTK